MDQQNAADRNQVKVDRGNNHGYIGSKAIIMLLYLFREYYVVYQAQNIAAVEYQQDTGNDALFMAKRAYVVSH